ncbi:hypothetical protein DCW30_17065 [Streptomyces alfalfae]|nr:hypothetical protein D3X13_32550 [Streptomyces fradiae]RXX42909.1 hypothetical protein DCW30_17065 [Streptomyces alfalfae]RZM93323.1 hypothetical protein D4104_19815 [Streptomyces alfalfae]
MACPCTCVLLRRPYRTPRRRRRARPTPRRPGVCPLHVICPMHRVCIVHIVAHVERESRSPPLWKPSSRAAGPAP